MSSSSTLEKAIWQVYAETDCAVEPILTTANLRDQFVAEVLLLVPSVSDDEVLQHLVKLRMRGANNGGLQRKPK